LSFGKREVTNTPHVKLQRIIVKLICHFMSQMILLQCIFWRSVYKGYSCYRVQIKRIVNIFEVSLCFISQAKKSLKGSGEEANEI
jgi:hypothetical protein